MAPFKPGDEVIRKRKPYCNGKILQAVKDGKKHVWEVEFVSSQTGASSVEIATSQQLKKPPDMIAVAAAVAPPLLVLVPTVQWRPWHRL
jgi:hypothetical protein